MVQDLLRDRHPDIAGLEFVGMGAYYQKTMPKFSTADGRRFVQIMNSDGDHWICVTTMVGSTTHDIYVYDSTQRKTLTTAAVMQISTILRNEKVDESSRLTVHIRKCARQQVRSRTCGLYAAAAAFACCNGDDPTGMDYYADSLRRDIITRLLDNSAENLPCRKRWPVADIATYRTRKLFLHLPSTTPWAYDPMHAL